MTTASKSHSAPVTGRNPVDIGDTICRAVEDLAHASAAPGVWSVLKGFGLSLGLDRMVVLEDCQDPTLSQLPVVLYDDMVLPGSDENAARWRDALSALRNFAAAKPFSVADATRGAGDQALSSLLALLGATDALVVPVSRLLQFKGVVLFAARAAGTPPDVSPIVRSALHVLAHCAFDRAHMLEREPKRRDAGILSPREAECLRWAAAGKTDNEIGAILTISPRTARFHIENAKRKLGVSTRIQAVAEALRLKAIAA
jgi:DNA-binding CsgD family transcriptional regulator